MPLRKVNFARSLLGSVVLLLPMSMMFAQDEAGARKATGPDQACLPGFSKANELMEVMVRSNVSVAPNGEAKDSKAIGGNPVSIQAAETAGEALEV